MVLGCGESSRQKETAKALPLNASMQVSGAGVSITNNDAFTYPNPEILIQQGAMTFYKAHAPNIAPGETATVPFFDFVNTDNERFNYYTTRPERIILSCTVNGQERDAGWQTVR
jgi:hypothetical protein